MDQATVVPTMQRASPMPRQAWNVRLGESATHSRPIQLVLIAGQAVPPAALWSIALWGRTTVQGMSARWAATFFLAWIASVFWGIASGASRDASTLESKEYAPAAFQWWHPLLGFLPASLLSLILVIGVYVSEDVHHAFVHRPELKGISLPLVLLMTLGVPVWQTVGEAAVGAQPGRRLDQALSVGRVLLARHELALVAVVLIAGGCLHA
ncbi:MAG TPA: hypothetical protein VGW38_15070, partial [Chloroflexota bacterium]|nr:hypothetical protein [Chloroflexota bacterium]